jgi:hypothetical protein
MPKQKYTPRKKTITPRLTKTNIADILIGHTIRVVGRMDRARNFVDFIIQEIRKDHPDHLLIKAYDEFAKEELAEIISVTHAIHG